jgi:ParB family chromosome partitioning protein
MPIPIQKGRLGRGLASLIGETPEADPRLPAHGEQRLLSIDQLHPSGHNPRKSFDDLELIDLTDPPGRLRPIIARDRRGAASRSSPASAAGGGPEGQPSHPAIVRELGDAEAAEFALIENVQRTDLNPIERRPATASWSRFGYTQEQVADAVARAAAISPILCACCGCRSVQALLQDGRLTSGHARALIGHGDAEALARRIVEEDLNVRAVEALVQDEDRGGGAAKSGQRGGDDKDADARAFEKDLSDSLGLKVEIKPGSGESGTLSIKYGNFDQLDYIRARLIGPPER